MKNCLNISKKRSEKKKEKLEIEEKEREKLIHKEHQDNVKRMKYNERLKEKIQKWEQHKNEIKAERSKVIDTERK